MFQQRTSEKQESGGRKKKKEEENTRMHIEGSLTFYIIVVALEKLEGILFYSTF